MSRAALLLFLKGKFLLRRMFAMRPNVTEAD
jgi:hypothetical protein